MLASKDKKALSYFHFGTTSGGNRLLICESVFIACNASAVPTNMMGIINSLLRFFNATIKAFCFCTGATIILCISSIISILVRHSKNIPSTFSFFFVALSVFLYGTPSLCKILPYRSDGLELSGALTAITGVILTFSSSYGIWLLINLFTIDVFPLLVPPTISLPFILFFLGCLR